MTAAIIVLVFCICGAVACIPTPTPEAYVAPMPASKQSYLREARRALPGASDGALMRFGYDACKLLPTTSVRELTEKLDNEPAAVALLPLVARYLCPREDLP